METRFRTPLMSAQEEYAGARAIEAGVLAEHLLATGERPVPATTAELRAIAEAGVRARRHFLLANLRLVRRLAGVEARRCGLPVDDLFQEGCVALAVALQRYDVERGRFSTFATMRIRQHLAEVCSLRFGAVTLPPGLAAQLRKLRGLQAELGQERGVVPGAAELAVLIGQDVSATRRLVDYRPPLAIDQLAEGPGLAEPSPEDLDAGIFAAQVRRLLARLEPDQARVIRLRHGLGGGEPLECGDVARRLGLSTSTVRRLEKRALDALRPLAAGLDPRRDQPMAG